MKQKKKKKKAPAAIGPYSQAIQYGKIIVTSGQLPIDAATGVMPAGVQEQTRQSIENLGAILEQAGSCFEKVIKTTVFIADMRDFSSVNEVYEKYFSGDCPARSCVEVARLPKDALVEIEAIAVVD